MDEKKGGNKIFVKCHMRLWGISRGMEHTGSTSHVASRCAGMLRDVFTDDRHVGKPHIALKTSAGKPKQAPVPVKESIHMHAALL